MKKKPVRGGTGTPWEIAIDELGAFGRKLENMVQESKGEKDDGLGVAF